jgi:hypothetical protein
VQPEQPINLMENIHREEFIGDYFPMQMWLNDNIPLRGEVYREFANYRVSWNAKKIFGFGLIKP